ncbi:MAG: DUF2892 domain-containing protein [Halolamina sp.]|uniref:YgaP family membrane protein n=1 Tax=Halolamina sp. TaxID=1940283 RepID=UPI002FC35AA7
MNVNIGATDRTVRLAAGALLAAVGLAGAAGILSLGPTVGVFAVLVGVVLIVTAMMRSCLVYRILGVDSCDVR